jgi:hypothetical protein
MLNLGMTSDGIKMTISLIEERNSAHNRRNFFKYSERTKKAL